MSSFGAQMRKRLNELHRAGQDVPKIMAEVAEGATIEAVRSGDMAQHWATDSQTTPVVSGGSVRTELNNHMQYASYVNDGHRVDKHFVPGLIKNGSLLERSPDGSGGLMVGTKTTYVKGKYMKQKAIGKYRSVIRTELDKRVREAFK